MPWKWRKATWALAIFNVLMLIWLISSLQGTANNCAHTASDQLGACQVGTGIGSGIVVVFLVGIWFVGFIVLSLIWLMSRPNKRICPQCGRDVKKGLVACTACGYSFVQAPLSPTVSP